MRTREGRVIWVHGSTRALRDADGRVTRYRGYHMDITARKQVEERFRLAADVATDLIYD